MNSQLQLLAAVSRCYHPTAAIDPPVVLRLRRESRKAATEVLICMSRAANRQQGELGLCSAEQHPLKSAGQCCICRVGPHQNGFPDVEVLTLSAFTLPHSDFQINHLIPGKCF